MHGWTGIFLEVDLRRKKIRDFEIPKQYYDMYLGGANLGAQLLWDFKAFSADALEPGNVLLFLTGPLSGTNFPGAGRTHLMARSPHTNLVGESSLGGYFAAPLKLAGYDGIIFHGKSDTPVYLEIDGVENQVALRSAIDLWGLDTYDTETKLRQRYPKRTSQVACIGPSGERLVPLAGIVHNRQFIAARTGMGAVMGSKNLKAVIVFARGKVSIADPSGYKLLRGNSADELDEDYWSQRRKNFGTIGNLEWAVKTGRAPTKNWQNDDWIEQSHRITGETLADSYLTGRRTCHGCPIVCKRVVSVEDGPFAVEEGPGPEYETGVSFGSLLLNDDLPSLLRANELCNRLGLDTIGVGGTIAWALEAVERGDLGEEWLDGNRMQWNDPAVVVDLVSIIGLRVGKLGELLSQGSAAAAKILNNNSSEYAMQVKGLELGYHHPQEARGIEITYATNPRGGTHTEAPNVFEKESESYENWAKEIARTSDQSTLANSYVLCMFNCTPLGVPFLGDVVTAVTGEDWSEDRLTLAAERGWYLKRSFNLLCGAGLEADTLPKRIRKQLKAAAVDHVDFDRALKSYHTHRQLDAAGYPAKEKLLNLNLEAVAQELYDA